MRTGLAISGAGHAAVLLLSVLTLVARPYPVDSTQALPIDVISSTEFSQITNGIKTAAPAEKPKPVAEKVGAATPPPDDPMAKLANKEIKAATDVPPVPERKPPEPKAKKPPQPPAPVDQIADVLKKDEDKRPDQKKPDIKPPTPPKKPAQEAPAFDPRNVRELLDKRTPQRFASAADDINNKPVAGDQKGLAPQLSQNELMAMQARLQQLWSPPAGAKDPQELRLEVDIQLKPDGMLAAPPSVVTSGSSPMFLAAKDSAIRAVYRGQPYTMLRPEHYEDWKEVLIVFDPRNIGSYY
jgi:outer membrane biosynthesis protein TonB